MTAIASARPMRSFGIPPSGICMISDITDAAFWARSRSSFADSFALTALRPNQLTSKTIVNATTKTRLVLNICTSPYELPCTSRIAPSGLAISSSRAFHLDSSAQEGAILCEALRSKREPHGLVRLCSDFHSIHSAAPQIESLIQRALSLVQLLRRKMGSACALREPHRNERLLNFSMDPTFGILHVIKARSFEVVNALEKLITNPAGLRRGPVLQNHKGTRCGDKEVRLRCDEQCKRRRIR